MVHVSVEYYIVWQSKTIFISKFFHNSAYFSSFWPKPSLIVANKSFWGVLSLRGPTLRGASGLGQCFGVP